MCRFIAYLSQRPITLNKIIELPENSLVNQSHQAREGKLGLNADGVGLAWYNHAINSLPGVYKSIQPAWNDQNLHHITSKIQSPCFLGHVRASTVGDVNLYNCHPFTHQQFSFVHNGTIRGFDKIKRSLLSSLSDESFGLIKGQTDSEHFFALLMDTIYKKNAAENRNFTLEEIAKALRTTITNIDQRTKNIDFSRLNIALTDGQQLLATRYVSDTSKDVLSLYYCIQHRSDGTISIVVASEPLTDYHDAWTEVPENHMVMVDEELSVHIVPLKLLA